MQNSISTLDGALRTVIKSHLNPLKQQTEIKAGRPPATLAQHAMCFRLNRITEVAVALVDVKKKLLAWYEEMPTGGVKNDINNSMQSTFSKIENVSKIL